MKELRLTFSVLLFIVFLFCLSACSKNSDEVFYSYESSEYSASGFIGSTSLSENNDEVSDYSGTSSIHNISSQNAESSVPALAEDGISDEKLKDNEVTVDFSTGNVISSSVSMDKTQSSSSYNGTSSVNVSSDTDFVEDDEGETSDEDVNTSSNTATVDPNKETMSKWTPWQ